MNVFNNICTRVYVSTQSTLCAFAKNDKGVTAIEYAVIAVAMSTLVLAAFNNKEFGESIKGAMKHVTTQLTSAKTPPA